MPSDVCESAGAVLAVGVSVREAPTSAFVATGAVLSACTSARGAVLVVHAGRCKVPGDGRASHGTVSAVRAAKCSRTVTSGVTFDAGASVVTVQFFCSTAYTC